MGIQIGAEPEHDFHQPLGLMSDCHRRIEKFLNILVTVADRARGGELDSSQQEGLDVALRYFRMATPLHNADEEQSLFPRMRAVNDSRVRDALAQIQALEADHRVAEAAHAEVDRLGCRWLGQGILPVEDATRLLELIHNLRATYARHIAIEDREVFPLAAETLDSALLQQVGLEMARRRGVDPDLPSALSRCSKRRAARQQKKSAV